MEKRIYFHYTDAGGVVYYGRYMNYLEESRTLFLENKGVDISLFQDKKFLYAVRNCTIAYKSPARYGDTIVCSAELINVTPARLTFKQEIHEKGYSRG